MTDMKTEVSVTELRRSIYKLLDQVAESGQSLTVRSKGRKLVIRPVDRPSRLSRLEVHPDCLVEDLDTLVEIDWSGQWTPCL